MITGATAPPTIVMMSKEEANLVFVPAFLNASEKIVGNMMLSPKYWAKNAMKLASIAEMPPILCKDIFFLRHLQASHRF